MRADLRDGPWGAAAEASPDPRGVLVAAERLWESLPETQREILWQEAEAIARLARFLAASPGLFPFLVRHPELVLQLFLEHGLESDPVNPARSGERERFLNECRASRDLEALSRRIALFRNQHLVRLYCQELFCLRPPPAIWAEWSQVAATCIEGGMEGVRKFLPSKGEGVRLAVMGMGKLGGGELNFASDIDLMFLYEASGGEGAARAREEATRWARAITQVLELATEEGPSFRVDLGLRPGGKDGDVVTTVEGAEVYYQTLAFPWERWALIKAYPVAGDRALGHAFVEMVRPFVFRRYLDYGSLREIRGMKERIQRELRWRKQDAVDVKMGRGGIREMEFLVQTLQIINGGKLPSLRARDTLGALRALVDEGLFPPAEGEALARSYLFLRGVEHRVQMVHHVRTHTLPVSDRELERISGLMGYRGAPGVKAFLKDLDGHMARVHAASDELLRGRDREWVPSMDPKLEKMLATLDDEQTSVGIMKALGFKEARAVRESIRRVLGKDFPARRSPAAREALHRLFPGMLSMVLRTSDPDHTLFRLERFLEAVGPRGGYYALLEENPKTMGNLIGLFGRSGLLSCWLGDHLEAVEALVDRGHYRPRRTKAELIQEMEGILSMCKDPEERLARLRVMRVQETLRIGVGELWGALDPWEASEELTELAEVLLELTLREAFRAAGEEPSGGSSALCVLGLGSFGGRELSYRSDLDIIFVYDEARSRRTSRGVSSTEKLTRVAQRCLSWMSMPMREGPGWAADVRLRPSGTRGPLMVSIDALARYHADLGRAWERQTLLKARACAGDASTGEAAMETISGVLAEAPPPDPQAFHSMRLRMERERGTIPREGGIHLKLGAGGMADIEFLAQYHQLATWCEDPSVRTSSTRMVIRRVMETGRIPAQEGESLLAAHLFFKGVENRLGLVLEHKGTDQPCTRQDLLALEPLEEHWVPLRAPGEGLPELLTRIMAGVRQLYLLGLLGPRPPGSRR